VVLRAPESFTCLNYWDARHLKLTLALPAMPSPVRRAALRLSSASRRARTALPLRCRLPLLPSLARVGRQSNATSSHLPFPRRDRDRARQERFEREKEELLFAGHNPYEVRPPLLPLIPRRLPCEGAATEKLAQHGHALV